MKKYTHNSKTGETQIYDSYKGYLIFDGLLETEVFRKVEKAIRDAEMNAHYETRKKIIELIDSERSKIIREIR